MNVDEDTLRRIIRSELSTELDAKFDAFESRIDTKFDNFEINLAKFFGKTHRYFDNRFNTFEKKFNKKSNKLQNSVDGIVKRLDDDDTECSAINNQLGRHDNWIGELARHTNATLSPP